MSTPTEHNASPKCSNGLACDEVTARYLAAARAHRDGVHEVAEQLAGTGDRFAEIHGLCGQLEQDVARSAALSRQKTPQPIPMRSQQPCLTNYTQYRNPTQSTRSTSTRSACSPPASAPSSRY